MSTSLQADLAELDGEQLYNLITRLDGWLAIAEAARLKTVFGLEDEGPIAELAAELRDVKHDALMQLARITIPVREAAAIIWRTRYARNHPVKVPGT